MNEKCEITVTIGRTNPETRVKPRQVEYTNPHPNRMRVMDALKYIRENVDSSLAYRWSCRYHEAGAHQIYPEFL